MEPTSLKKHGIDGFTGSDDYTYFQIRLHDDAQVESSGQGYLIVSPMERSSISQNYEDFGQTYFDANANKLKLFIPQKTDGSFYTDWIDFSKNAPKKEKAQFEQHVNSYLNQQSDYYIVANKSHHSHLVGLNRPRKKQDPYGYLQKRENFQAKFNDVGVFHLEIMSSKQKVDLHSWKKLEGGIKNSSNGFKVDDVSDLLSIDDAADQRVVITRDQRYLQQGPEVGTVGFFSRNKS